MAKTSSKKSTNEQEFQGHVVSWANEFILKRKIDWLDKATQEKPGKSNSKRNDFVVWTNRLAQKAFVCIELKTPTTAITDAVLFQDALTKAQHWGAPIFGIWNMQAAELYMTPTIGEVSSLEPFFKVKTDRTVHTVEDWLKEDVETSLKAILVEILDAAIATALNSPVSIGFDAEVFVSRLEEAISGLRKIVYADLHKATKANRKLRGMLNGIAASQGFAGFVDDVDFAIAGQMGYRLVGQILFYFALRRKNGTLPAMNLDPTNDLAVQLRTCWDKVRRYDYEALYGPTNLDSLIPISKAAQKIILDLVEVLSHYDWSSLRDDVLGAVFERLIPREEQVLLGQFYTPKPVADLLVSLVVDGESPLVLDPGCGSGTFLMSVYDYQAKSQSQKHSDILPKLWGFDLSPFATELAAINLYRQDFSSFDNFPRVVPGSFFDRQVGQRVELPPAKPSSFAGMKKQQVPIPLFDAIVANPPYLRSQNQDDLDPKYRSVLFASAAAVGVKAPPKTDLFAFFLFHASNFLKDGGRVGFVTPISWLSSDYGTVVKQFLISNMSLVAIITSEAESFFSQVDVNTILVIAEKATPSEHSLPAKFITLKRPIDDLVSQGGHYWDQLLALSAKIEDLSTDHEDSDFRLKVLPLTAAAAADPKLVSESNWSRYLRAPLSYYQLFGTYA